MSTLYNSKQVADAIETAIRSTRDTVLAEERARVSRAIFLFGNTLADARCAEVVYELLPFLYDIAEREESDRVYQ
jgi:hypothetical protein